MKKAIIYYSLSKNTKEWAEKIAAAIGADAYQIDTVKPMPEGKNQQIMFGGMQATFGLRPAIKGVPANLSEYDEILLGTPIWAGKMAPAFNTFLKKNPVQGKVTGVFMLSGSGNAEKCDAKCRQMFPNLKATASLVDHYNELSKGNEEKVAEFVKAF